MRTLKDYYDILGIRRTAKPAEIDLAFKGRRTQYHPDKYAGSDEETVRWATEKMQEINEAYATLSDQTTRRRYDESRGARHEAPRSPQRASSHQEEHLVEDKPFIFDYLRRIRLDAIDAKRFHLFPNIPEQKLRKAISSRRCFASSMPKQVYLLVDDTLLGGGADGLLITDEFISFKSSFLDSGDYYFARWITGDFYLNDLTIMKQGKEWKAFSMVSRSALQMLVDAINHFFADCLAWHYGMARQDNAESQFILSLSLHDRPDEALHWLTLAAENGQVNAQHNLGKHFEYTDPELAYRWFAKAAAQGSETPCAPCDQIDSSSFVAPRDAFISSNHKQQHDNQSYVQNINCSSRSSCHGFSNWMQ